MHVDRDDLDTGARDQDACDGTEVTMPLTHTHTHLATLLLAQVQEWRSVIASRRHVQICD